MNEGKELLSDRKELLDRLKSLGVKRPSRLYPKVKPIAMDDDPTCNVLRMRAHIADLESQQESANK